MPDRFRPNILISSSIIACSLLFGAIPALAITTIESPYDVSYSFTDLGSVPGVPPNYGGLTFKAGDPSKLLIGGAANGASGKIYEIAVNRDGDGHVTGFNGTATAVIDAPYNDGGVLYGPGGVLFLARWQVNELGQVKPGSNVTDKVIDMDGLTDVSLSALNFPPPGFPGDGRLKLAVYDNGKWYDTTISPDGTGTYNLGNVTNIPGSTLVGDGPEGWIYVVPGSPVFDPNKRYLLLSAYSADEVVSYELDVNGDPMPSTRSVFMSGLNGAEGATIDPLTGDFVFSTFGGGNHVVVVEGFLPPPNDTDDDGVPDSSDNCSDVVNLIKQILMMMG